jgi:hypothetical protein
VRRWTSRRLRSPGITGLEVWDHPTPRGPLWRLLSSVRLGQLAGSGVRRQEFGDILLDDLGPAMLDLARLHGADAIYLAGGLTGVPGFASTSQARAWPLPVAVDLHGPWSAAEAGRRLFDDVTVAVDVGQTALKAIGPAGRVRRRRPAAAPPLLIGTPRPQSDALEALVDAIVAWVAEGLRAARGGAPLARLVLALPCPLDDALVPGLSTLGVEGRTDLVARLLDAVDRDLPADNGPWAAEVLNDAELAAESARSLCAHGRVLCLTLGFGPGGALVDAQAQQTTDRSAARA